MTEIEQTTSPASSSPASLTVGFAWMLVGNVIYAGSQWGMLIVLARIATPATVGQFALGLAITAPVIMLTNLQLRGVQATDVHRHFSFSDYLGLRLMCIPMAWLIIGGALAAGGYARSTATIVLVIGFMKTLEAVSDTFYGLFQQHERMKPIAISMMIKGPLSLTALGLAVAVTDQLIWGVVALAGSIGLVLILYDLPNGRHIGHGYHERLAPRLHGTVMRQLVKLAAPLGVTMMLMLLNLYIPQYWIERTLGQEALGIFAAMLYLVIAGNTVILALGETAMPRLARYYHHANRKGYDRLLLKLVGIGAMLGIGFLLVAIVAGDFVLMFLYGPRYAQQAEVFVIMAGAAGLGFISSFLGYGLLATRAFAYCLIPYSIAAVIAVGCCFWLIPHGGLQGAAWALVITNASTIILAWGLLVKLRPKPANA